MIRALIPVLVGASLVIPVPAMGQEAEGNADTAAPNPGSIVVEREREKKPRKICTRTVATGSIMSKVICKPAVQVEAERARTERATEQLLNAQETMQQTMLQQGDAQK